LLGEQKSAWELVTRSQGDVTVFIEEILTHFPLFRDEATYRGRKVGFYKRAQLLCQDLALMLSAYGVTPFWNLDALTAFADFKLPQLLREEGALRYDETLAESIDRRKLLSTGSVSEIEIRGATIVAVEEIRHALVEQGDSRTSADVDTILWTEAVRRGTSMRPHHRTRTTDY
jgi:hypothetical protein